MKIILLSDLHLTNTNPVGRLDNVVDVQWEKLAFVFMVASTQGVSLILQAGDMTDTKRSWELLQKLSFFLSNMPDKIKVFCVKGQHDSYYHSMDNQKTIVGVLESSKLVAVLNDKPINIGDVSFYGASYGEDIPKVITPKSINILVVHRQILVNKIYAQQKDYELAPAFLKEHDDYDLILCGDVHQKFQKGYGESIICNTGPLLRLEATQAMIEHEPGFFIYDTDRLKKNPLQWVKIPCAKGSDVLSREHIKKQKDRQHNFEAFIQRVQETDDTKSISFDENLKIIMQKNETSKPVRSIVVNYLAEDKVKER